jgi:heme/copper-type cytochrome/quinol oxidase subunit 2
MSGPDPDETSPTWETYQAPPPQVPYGQPPYGQPPYASPYDRSPYGSGATPHPQANTALILGVVALAGTFVCGVLCVLGPFAWSIGARVRREIDADPQRWSGRSEATAGYVLGIVTTILMVLALLAVAFVVMLLVAATPQ